MAATANARAWIQEQELKSALLKKEDMCVKTH